MLSSIPNSTDVFVVGGGPAGLAAAIAARSKGFDVVVADAARPPIEKACGEGLMPGALAALERLGVVIGCEHTAPFRGIRFLDDRASVEANFQTSRGVGIRRIRLHQALIDRAEAAGVRMLWGAPVTAIGDGAASVAGRTIPCRWLIGADGQNSRVRRWAGLDRTRTASLRYGFRRHYRVSHWSDYMEIHWGPKNQLYVTPVAPDEVCVALIARSPQSRLDDALPDFPELAARLHGVAHSTPERGAVTISRRLHRVFRGYIALIGDASGSVDAITGDGLCLSFLQAEALADALAAADLDAYEAAHRKLMWRPALMSRLMLLLDSYPWLRRRTIHAFASKPEIFATLLAMHLGDCSLADFLSDAMLPLGWRILTA